MEKALKAGDIDVMSRTHLAQPDPRAGHAPDKGIDLVEQPGQEIRYLVFNMKAATTRKKRRPQGHGRRSSTGRRSSRDVYAAAPEPLYSLVPAGMTGHRNSFFNTYGEPERRRPSAPSNTPASTTPSS